MNAIITYDEDLDDEDANAGKDDDGVRPIPSLRIPFCKNLGGSLGQGPPKLRSIDTVTASTSTSPS